MKITEIRELTDDELATQRRDLKHEVMNLRLQQQSGQLENPARLRTIRRTIARIETTLTDRRKAAAAPKA
ncbi:50S ribosomal protein L29 [soil metagenome]